MKENPGTTRCRNRPFRSAPAGHSIGASSAQAASGRTLTNAVTARAPTQAVNATAISRKTSDQTQEQTMAQNAGQATPPAGIPSTRVKKASTVPTPVKVECFH